MKKNLKKLAAMLLALTMALSVTGYAAAGEDADAEQTEPAEEAADAKQAGPAEEADEEQTADEAEEAARIARVVLDLTEEGLAALPCIGEKTEECSTIALLNDTGDDITAINIKSSEDTEWSDNILAEDYVFEDGEPALLCWEAEEGVLYDLQFTFSDWTVGVAHDVDFADTPGAELHRQWNGLPYLVYISLSTREKVDTSEAEQARAEAEIAAGTWAYGGGSSSGGSSSSSGGGSSSGGSSSGGGEGCLDDALFW